MERKKNVDKKVSSVAADPDNLENIIEYKGSGEGSTRYSGLTQELYK